MGGSLTSFGQCTLSQLYTYKNSVTMKVDYERFNFTVFKDMGEAILSRGRVQEEGHTKAWRPLVK